MRANRVPLVLVPLALAPVVAGAQDRPKDERAIVAQLHERAADEHVDQGELTRFLELNQPRAGFLWAFAQGEELFESEFTALDGGGAHVGGGERYTRVPRMDLTGPGEWAEHFPPRVTGPNAITCTACHSVPANDGSGGPSENVHSDPRRTGALSQMIQRNTPHLFGAGALQRLAEEMTEELQALRDLASLRARQTGEPAAVPLVTHGVGFGVLRAIPSGDDSRTVAIDMTGVEGVDPDLVVRPFQWKGSIASVRAFSRNALHNELGIQAVELVGAGRDGDFDGVVDELTVGDLTALAVYVAGQPRPTTRAELAELGLITPLTDKETGQIRRGERVFAEVQCTSCHVPALLLKDTIFREPSAQAAFRDTRFPAGQDPLELGVDPSRSIAFDLVEDLPDNVVDGPDGSPVAFGSFEFTPKGAAIVRLFGDLKRHDLGPGLAEQIDETGTGRSTFLTENLWGVGSTAPYLHDGRATTLAEAILAHGGEAAASRAAFAALPALRQIDLIAFLQNLVLFKIDPLAPPRNP